MSCLACGLSNQVEFSAEMIVHLGGLKNLDYSGVLLFPKLMVCVSCGFSQFTVLKAELALLASDSPKSERVTMAAAG
jgi:mannitol-specific phosphotransferase system IIBC component